MQKIKILYVVAQSRLAAFKEFLPGHDESYNRLLASTEHMSEQQLIELSYKYCRYKNSNAKLKAVIIFLFYKCTNFLLLVLKVRLGVLPPEFVARCSSGPQHFARSHSKIGAWRTSQRVCNYKVFGSLQINK